MINLSVIVRKYNGVVYGSALLFLLVAAYIHAVTLQTPYTGLLFREDGGVWIVASVDPAGHAAKWNVRVGDRLVAADGKQPDNLVKLGDRAYLKQSGTLQFERSGHGAFEIHNDAGTAEVYKGLFAACAELALLAIGLAAYRNKPESFMVRRFYALNLFIAATLLSVYSTETALTGLILPVVASWLPYLLLAFFVAFVFRSVPRWIGAAMAAYRVLAAIFATYVLLIFSIGAIPGWTRDAIHAVLIGMLIAIFAIAAAYWRSMDRAEKNKLLTFVAALAVGLLPYLFLGALPDLLWGEYMAPPDMTLAGLIVLPASVLSLWARQRLIDVRFYLPRLAIHSLYAGLAMILIAALVRSGASPATLALCGAFAALALLHRFGIDSVKRQRERREDRFDRQRLEMSIRLAEHRNSRDLLRMPAELVYSVTDIEGLCFVWNRGAEAVVYGTGLFAEMPERTAAAGAIPREALSERHGFVQVLDLVQPDGTVIGYLGLGAKTNNTAFTSEEFSLIDKVRQETVRLLTNASLLDELRRARVVVPVDGPEHRLLEAQQAERVRTSYYLHDHILQNLIFLARDLEELHDTGQSDKRLTAVWLKCLYDTQRDIRMLCDDLYPHIVDQAGLGDALRWLARTMKENGGPSTELNNELPETLPPLYKMALFRVVRELANNTAKHAKANKLAIRLWETDDAICGQIGDDGVGFDPTAAGGIQTGGRGFGLATIGSQIAQFGGVIDIDSAPGRGTIIRLRLPKRAEAKHEASDQSAAG